MGVEMYIGVSDEYSIIQLMGQKVHVMMEMAASSQTTYHFSVNSLRPSDAYMRQWSTRHWVR